MTRQNLAASLAITIRWRPARPLCWLGQRPHAEGWAVPPIIVNAIAGATGCGKDAPWKSPKSRPSPPRLGIPPTPWDSHFPITPAAEGRLTETGISRATKSGCFNLLQTWTVQDTRLRGANRTPEFRETPLFIPWRVGGRP